MHILLSILATGTLATATISVLGAKLTCNAISQLGHLN